MTHSQGKGQVRGDGKAIEQHIKTVTRQRWGSSTLSDRAECSSSCPCSFASDKQNVLLQPQEGILTNDLKTQKHWTIKTCQILNAAIQTSLQRDEDAPLCPLDDWFSGCGLQTPRTWLGGSWILIREEDLSDQKFHSNFKVLFLFLLFLQKTV